MNKSQLLKSLKNKGFSKQILDAFSEVPRKNFIPENLKPRAYEDTALPIGKGQTISQPYTIAVMLQLLELKQKNKVLEIGSGCGYVLALISQITKSKVYGIEIIKELAEKSKQNLKDYENIKIYNKNGANGLKEHSPYDKILISAACKEIPKIILNQLKNNGILVAPVDSDYGQDLVAIHRRGDKFIEKQRIPGFVFVRFVNN